VNNSLKPAEAKPKAKPDGAAKDTPVPAI